MKHPQIKAQSAEITVGTLFNYEMNEIVHRSTDSTD